MNTMSNVNPQHKNQAGQPSVNGGHFAAKTNDEAPTGILSDVASNELGAAQDAAAERVSHFLTGSKTDLSKDQADTIVALAAQFPGKANVTVNDEDDVWLMYTEPGHYDDEHTTRVTLNNAGEVVSGGSGEEWDNNDWDDETYLRLIRDGFGEDTDTLNSGQSRKSLVAQALEHSGERGGVGLLSIVNDQGTSISEATLCTDHFRGWHIDDAEAAGLRADDVTGTPRWEASTENDQVHCQECGAGSSDGDVN
jgi:hypothetical protein